jgi:hypothetical protein
MYVSWCVTPLSASEEVEDHLGQADGALVAAVLFFGLQRYQGLEFRNSISEAKWL